MNASASTSVATWAFGSRPVRRRRSTTVRPRHSSDAQSTSTLTQLRLEQPGSQHVRDGEGVVDGRGVVAVDHAVEAHVEGVQVGHEGADAAAAAQLGRVV